jgi:hypothetical protein
MRPKEFATAGVDDPGAPNAVERHERLEWLVARGVSRFTCVVGSALAQVAEAAVAGETLVTAAVADQIWNGMASLPAGRRARQGFPEPVTPFSVGR